MLDEILAERRRNALAGIKTDKDTSTSGTAYRAKRALTRMHAVERSIITFDAMIERITEHEMLLGNTYLMHEAAQSLVSAASVTREQTERLCAADVESVVQTVLENQDELDKTHLALMSAANKSILSEMSETAANNEMNDEGLLAELAALERESVAVAVPPLSFPSVPKPLTSHVAKPFQQQALFA
jgi:hypothetical protein